MPTEPKREAAFDGVDKGMAEARLPYEKPVLTVVGNLQDLLAQGGTQNTDPGNACFTPGATFTAGCAG